MTRILDLVPDRVREQLDDWRPWMVLAIAGLVFAITWLYFVNSRTVREVATRKATASATASTNYEQCIRSIPGLKKINTFLEGENDLVDVLVQNSLANLGSTLQDDPQYKTRQANLGRLLAARAKIAAVDALPVPTPNQCLIRRGGG